MITRFGDRIMSNPRPLIILFGLAAWGVCPSSTMAGTFNTLYQFLGGSTGSVPVSSVIQDATGIIYGQTYQAGDLSCVTTVGSPSFGCGTLYSFSSSTGLKTLVEFNGPNGAYGYNSPTLVGSTLYGTTLAGGATDKGVIYSVLTNGSKFRLLHQFSGTDGSEPAGALVKGPGGVLYGVTEQGGPAYPKKSYGVLFKLTVDGTYTVLHSFGNGTDGGGPDSIIVEKSGLIVGSTFQGGNKRAACGSSGCGVLFDFSPTSGQFKVIYTFTASGSSGSQPSLGSVAPNGTVYGNAGGFFAFSSLSGFMPLPASGGSAIGYGMNIPPVLGPDGSLTSTEPQGPYSSSGTLYEQLNGALTPLHTFDGGPDGGAPEAAPLLTKTGSFIGTTGGGGAACGCGTIYEYSP